MASRILVIDDEPTVRALFEAVLAYGGHTMIAAEDGRAGLEKFRSEMPDLVFSDLLMPDMDGLTFLEHARAADPDVPVVLMTAFSDKSKLMRAVQLAAFDFIEKPFDVEAIEIALDRGLRQRALLAQRRRSELATARVERFARLINSAALLEQLYAVARAELAPALGVRFFSLLVFDAPTDTVELVATNIPGLEGGRRRRAVLAGPLREALDRREAVAGDAPPHEGYAAFAGAALPELGGAVASVPLIVRNDLVGVLTVHDKLDAVSDFDERDTSFLHIAAEHLASAIDVRRKAEELRQTLDELHRTQQHLVQSEKLAAVTKLVAGIAHEIKNPLTSLHFAITNLSDELRRYADDGVEVSRGHRFIEAVLGDVARLRDKVDSFMMFARPETAARRPCDAADVVRAVVAQLAARLDATNITVEQLLEPELPEAIVDPDAFFEAVLNLVVNAVEAIGHDGHIMVSARAADGALLLEVIDDGPGVPAAAAGRLFELFYTTKAKGSGIGLSQVHVFCDTHGGKISFENGARGARFSMRLPILARAAEESA